ncbi:MAG: hypothetical protein ACI9JN_002894 [Bacteroidia bacterium]|jgi:hypothetical protein
MSKPTLKYKGDDLAWPAVYLKIFAPLMVIVMITVGIDAWVEYVEGGTSPFFYKNIITIVVIGVVYALFGFKIISKTTAINFAGYPIYRYYGLDALSGAKNEY